jgi:chromosome segregation protein
MYLKSLSLKGFKSFPDRTKLDFAPGVSVIVGPNGSGKSNVTDAVLWVMGEQSPLAVRGQSMQDVIFAGGRGSKARPSAEVELVLDNSDGVIDLPAAEISIVRKLDRNGEGEYRLNGARCRMVDVLEVLSDTGLGKEMHSVVSQGRVEAIVTSKPKDRRLLIEEAAGLGKHRKRRRRAQLKLEKTQDNLDRALDIEREARTRLKPLKRQAEAAESHARLERQVTEARWELAREAVRARRAELTAAEADAQAARQSQEAAQVLLAEIAQRRGKAEAALAARTERREALTRGAEKAAGAADRVELRLERTRETVDAIKQRSERREHQLEILRDEIEQDGGGDGDSSTKIEALQLELAKLESEREAALEQELASLHAKRAESEILAERLAATVAERRDALAAADKACDEARTARREAETAAEAARREAARVGAELARANQFIKTHSDARSRSLADDLEVERGLELALAAALGGRLSAALTASKGEAAKLLDAAGSDGGHAFVTGASVAGDGLDAPVGGARRLAELVTGPENVVALARHLLRDAWVVDSLDMIDEDFAGIAVTTSGRAWLGRDRELFQATEGSSERVLAERNRRDTLITESETAVVAEQQQLAAIDAARDTVTAVDVSRDEAETALRQAEREHAEAAESVRACDAQIARRKQSPEHGDAAVRHAQVSAELAAERAVAERLASQRKQRSRRVEGLRHQLELDRALAPLAQRLADQLTIAESVVREHAVVLDGQLTADRAEGEGDAAELTACSEEEGKVQATLRDASALVTTTEVKAQQLRDLEAESAAELESLAEALGLEAAPREDELDPQEAEKLEARIAKLQRQRENLGPVNPLAKQEYDEAVASVEEMETQRTDMETALRELRTFIRDTDREISQSFEETFNAAAANFETLAETLFPGGRGRLRLVREEKVEAPTTDSGDGSAEVAQQAAAEDAADDEATGEGDGGPDEDLGVEIEITPAGKSMKRLTLLSGGEKSMTAIAFLFAVFLARPCPFYILDEVEAALDDANISRFLHLLREHSGHAQFIVVTHQKRTMEAADTLYGVSMGGDGISKVISHRLPQDEPMEITASRGSSAVA